LPERVDPQKSLTPFPDGASGARRLPARNVAPIALRVMTRLRAAEITRVWWQEANRRAGVGAGAWRIR